MATAEKHLGMEISPDLLTSILRSVDSALMMCNISAKCVGVSRVPTGADGMVSGMIGVHGKVSGFVHVNLGRRFALQAVAGLLDEKFTEITSQVIDGVGEITNIITGGLKSELAQTRWSFPHITIPSVIVGQGYQISYAKGLEFLNVTFEHQDPEAVMLSDRLMHVCVSLLPL